ncbi:MAG: hypothetical protein AB7U85_01295 [Alphaproteobacteria bacterium]
MIKILTAVIFFLIFYSPITYAQEAVVDNQNACLTETERKAFSFRALQTNYMVAALSCENMLEDYNVFINKFHSTFVENGEVLKKYFARCYGIKGRYNLDQFVTILANKMSMFSLKDAKSFCKKSHDSILKCLNLEQSDFKKYDFNTLSNYKLDEVFPPRCE